MLSKGGKREWLCPECESKNINKLKFFHQISGECGDCNTWWPWTDRINVKAEITKT